MVIFLMSLQQAFADLPRVQDHHNFYIGPMIGYGATTWDILVPANSHSNMAMKLSTPVNAEEGGFAWGVFGGVEINDYFAIESAYTHYPKSTIHFDEISLFSFDHNDRTYFSSETDTINLMAKLMVHVPDTSLRAYSSFGVAGVRRFDELFKTWRISPTFGAGINLKKSTSLMFELGGQYTAGYGESQLSPADRFVPFLYSVFVRMGYFF